MLYIHGIKHGGNEHFLKFRKTNFEYDEKSNRDLRRAKNVNLLLFQYTKKIKNLVIIYGLMQISRKIMSIMGGTII